MPDHPSREERRQLPTGEPPERGRRAAGFDGPMRRALGRVEALRERYRAERQAAPSLAAELLAHPPARQRLLVKNRPRFRTWGLCEHLLERGREQRFAEPAAYEAYALLAIAVAEALPESVYGRPLVEDLLASGWAELGNARRILSDFRSAERAFLTAGAHLARGCGDPLERARLADLEASLRNAQGRTDEAHALLDRAIGIYRLYGARHREGRALVKKALAHHYAGESETAVAVLAAGLPLADPRREPRLVLTARHNLAEWLRELGRYDEALSTIAESRPLYLAYAEPLDLVRLRQVEGRIASALGRDREAEAALREARQGFIGKGIGFDAALVSLDLAALYARQGRSREVRVLGEEMLGVFGSRGVHAEAMAALILFEQAAAAEQVTAALVREVSRRLERAHRDTGSEP